MDFEDSPQEAAFRTEVRSWLEANVAVRKPADISVSLFFEERDEAAALAEARRFQAKLADDGWAAISWPAEYGGRGAGMAEALVYQEELSRYGVAHKFFSIGLSMIGPTLMAHGTPEQKSRYLKPMVKGDEIWCQLWSEPGAGSDLASLSTRADIDPATGDFILNGQKVWSSGAHYSAFGLGIFRSDPDAPKRQGISALVVDLSSPGVTIRPLRQMTGGANFNEVFFTDVVVPRANLVGDLHDGWRVARTTMMNERISVGGAASPAAAFPALVELARSQGRAADPLVRQAIASIYSQGRLFDLTFARVRTAVSRSAIPGPESSILKLFAADCWADQAALAMQLLGAEGTLDEGSARGDGRWQQALLGAPAVRIGGGTDQIQRNIMGEQILGLPREPT